jgi:hypothetical protein
LQHFRGFGLIASFSDGMPALRACRSMVRESLSSTMRICAGADTFGQSSIILEDYTRRSSRNVVATNGTLSAHITPAIILTSFLLSSESQRHGLLR